MRTLTTPGPLDTLEDAFDLLQRAPAALWLGYLLGAAPLIVGLLYVWNEFSGASSANDNPVLAATFLVAVLVWFYRCRQVFAVRLRRILGLTRADDKPPRANWAVACFEGIKLLAMPIVLLSVLSLGVATAFYRSITLFAGEGMPARDALSKAWKAATIWQRENWFALSILTLLEFVVFVDVALAVVIAPILVKMFTGFESPFTKNTSAALSIELPVIVALTWLCFDPLLTAIYTVRAFRWEGLRSGEDLLVRLKRLAPLFLLAVICALPAHLSAAPAPTLTRDTLNQSIDRTLQSHDYDWRIPPPPAGADKHDWFLDTVDHIVTLIKKGWKVITDLWSDLLDWIDRLFRPFMPSVDRTNAGKPVGVRPVFYVFAAVILLITLFLLWKFGPGRTSQIPVAPASVAIDLNNENVLATDLPEDEWLRLADGYLTSGDLRLALRALYLGSLALLNHRGFLTIHACKSNRDYERELRRRSRDNDLSQIFRLNLRSFEQSWYGFHEVTGDQVQAFRENLGRMRTNA